MDQAPPPSGPPDGERKTGWIGAILGAAVWGYFGLGMCGPISFFFAPIIGWNVGSAIENAMRR